MRQRPSLQTFMLSLMNHRQATHGIFFNSENQFQLGIVRSCHSFLMNRQTHVTITSLTKSTVKKQFSIWQQSDSQTLVKLQIVCFFPG
jgi:hypothetical protein